MMNRKDDQIKTYKVIDPSTGGTLNHVTHADNERDNDEISVREEKRRVQAEKLAQCWNQNFYNNTKSLKVVEA